MKAVSMVCLEVLEIDMGYSSVLVTLVIGGVIRAWITRNHGTATLVAIMIIFTVAMISFNLLYQSGASGINLFISG